MTVTTAIALRSPGQLADQSVVFLREIAVQQTNAASSGAPSPSSADAGQVRVRLWLDTHVITDFTGSADQARAHAAVVSDIHRSLTLTVEPAVVDQPPAGDAGRAG